MSVSSKGEVTMEVKLVDLKAQYNELKEQLDAAVLEVMASGMYAAATNVRLLEEEMAASVGAKHAVAVNSGTDALKIALEALPLRPGDEVITTPFTFVATIEAIIQAGGRPVFVDIEPRTFNMDVSQIRAAVTPRTRAILPIHLFGQIAEMEPIMEIADVYGLFVLEDAAQAIGSTRNGLPTGSWGHAAALSFFPTKNLGAAGDGGMLITNDDSLAERARSLRVHGMGREPYTYDFIGHTSRLDEVQAAVLRVKFQKLGQWNEARRAHARIYDAALAGTEVTAPYVLPETTYHTYHQYTIRHPNRDRLAEYLREHGAGSAIYYPVPLHLQPAYGFLNYRPGDFPASEAACRQVLSLPIHAHLTTEQVEYVADVVKHFVAERAAV